jgi:ATP-dependent Lon protease
MPKKQKLPMIAVRGLIVFPFMVVHFDVAREPSKRAIDASLMDDQLIFLAAQRDINDENPDPEDIYEVGTVAEIRQILKLPGDVLRVLVEGKYRSRISEYVKTEPYFEVKVTRIKPREPNEEEKLEIDALMHMCGEEFENFTRISNRISPDSLDSIKSISDPERFTDIVAANVLEELEDKQSILEQKSVIRRLETLYKFILEENQRLNIERKITMRVKKQIDRSQKEYYLREQIKAIQKELGDTDSNATEELLNKVSESDMPEEVKEKALKELDRMSKMNSTMPELSIIRTYVEWLLDLPWATRTEDNLDLDNAATILNEDHYGMDKVKERILEYLAVRQLKKDMKGPILCFVGPPGVGKTSIARSVARALGRKFVRMSLGGVRDEAEIRGHRKTYIGAIPGRIISSMKQAGTINPVFLFDEIDKMGTDFRGDPASAMLEVFDSEQNFAFRDHYLEVPYDLSKVMFIATANTTDTIPRPLMDRMEIIELSSYTELEKLEIAKRHLLPKQEEENGLEKKTVTIDDRIMLEIINSYTREAGVRALERELGKICRRAAREVVTTKKKKIRITRAKLYDYLGAPKYLRDHLAKKPMTGTVTGLAWTAVGGETLSIDVVIMPGSGELTLTGQLGDVMKESAKAALSLIRSRAKALGIDEEFAKKNDIHIHIPQGAIPKDGPSAGVTMFTAMVSALTQKPVSADLAMTGEITLRGKVLPIGGLKEKAIAAHRAGINTILIPKDNQKDIEEIPQSVTEALEIIPVGDVDMILGIAFNIKSPKASAEKGTTVKKDGDKKG